MLALFTAFGGGAGIFHVGPAALLLLVPPVLLVFGLFLVTRYITHFFIRIGAAVITCTAFVLIASYVLTALGGA
jgi:hypothetical protein